MRREMLTGNGAAAWGVRLAEVDYVPTYPITPQTEIIETLASWIADGAMDEDGFRANMAHWIDDLGIDGFFIAGKQGEFFSMSLEERKRCFDLAVECAGDKAQTIMSCSDQNMDVVIDLVAGDTWPQYLEVLCPQGRYAAAGAVAGPLVELDIRTLYLKDLSLFGCTVLKPEVFNNLIKRIEQGVILPVVARSFALDEIREAQMFFLEKQHVGKIVLRVN